MTLNNALEGKEYTIKDILTDDPELKSFLLSLGCYTGEVIYVISKRRSGLVITLKDARYNIDNQLAEVIIIF